MGRKLKTDLSFRPINTAVQVVKASRAAAVAAP